MALTVPETPEWTGAERGLSLSPTIWPTSTASPGPTTGSHGTPRCWDMARMIVSGGGITTVSQSAVCLRWGAWTPPLTGWSQFFKGIGDSHILS